MGVAALLSAALLAVTPASYVGSRQQADGGFAEPGSSSTPGLTATGRISETLYARFAALVRPDGRIGPAINSTAWGILASAQVGRPVKLRVSYLLNHQRRSGGWGCGAAAPRP